MDMIALALYLVGSYPFYVLCLVYMFCCCYALTNYLLHSESEIRIPYQINQKKGHTPVSRSSITGTNLYCKQVNIFVGGNERFGMD